MEDLRLAIGLIAFVSIAVFSTTFRLLRNRSKTFLDVVAVLIVALIAVYVQTVWGQLWIVKWIPLSSVIVLSNWFPPLLAALGATVWLRLEPATLARRMPIMIVVVAAAVYSIMHFVPTEPPECGNEWDRGIGRFMAPVCRQTTNHTCSAAAAATILRTLGIESSEQEMARLCLTRSGTTWLGLYHGLATKLRGTDYRVEFFEGDVADLKKLSASYPVLLCCELNEQVAQMMPTFVTEGGWIPGLAHSVVYFGEYNKIHVIGDPSRGYEAWNGQELNTLWTGTGLTIVEIGMPQTTK